MSTIKKLSLKTFLIMFVCAMAFTGCSKKSNDEDSPSGISKSKLTGKWYYVTTVEKDKETGDTDTDNWTNGEYVVFNTDGSVYDSDDDETGTYQLSGSSLRFTSTGVSNTAEVKKLTSSQLVLYYNAPDYESTVTFRR